MKKGMHGLMMALLVALCSGGPVRVFAQQDHPLDKKIALKADNERLEDVLNELAKGGYFTFSYKSDILKKDRLITLTIKESTLREALELILGKAYDYLESDDYVIIRPKVAKANTLYVEPVAAMKMKKSALAAKRSTSYGHQDSLDTRDSRKLVKLRYTVRYIIEDMIADGIVKDKDSFAWFALDNGQFVVDGKHQADSLRIRYAEKYVGPDGSGYYCGTLSGVTGRGYFFDKNEIYGEGKQ